MKNRFIFLLMTMLVMICKPVSAENMAFFVSDPTLSPDAKTIVFVYENDLWQVPSSGGTAYRLTALQGKVSVPRFSPDGKWIAFSSTRDRNANIYVMPARGGEIRQLTFHESTNMVDSWSWDSEHIYFYSTRENMSSVYRIPVNGGTPLKLFNNYFNIEHHLVEHPLTGEYIFTESWESLTFSHRKRYRGEHNPDLLSYNKATDQFKSLTHFEGQDLWPTIDRQGNIYYASDEFNGEYNLYTLREGEKVQLTHFSHSIRRPQVSADGSMVVFEKDYRLYTYQVATGDTLGLDVELFQAPPPVTEQSFSVSGNISYFDVSPDEKKLAFVSRGELFVSDIEGKFVRRMPVNPSERVIEVKWLADSKTLLYTRTHNGWANLFTIGADGRGAERRIEDAAKTSRLLSMSPDRKKAVYLSGRNDVKIADLTTFTTWVAVSGELWGFQNSTPSFSPDGQYLLYTTYHNFEQDVKIYNLNSGREINITRSGVTQRQPFWSPDGKFIYVVSDRVNPSYPRGNTTNRIYRIALHRFAPAMRGNSFDTLFIQQAKRDSLPPVIVLDTLRMDERWELMDINSGEQWSPMVFNHKKGQVMFFVSNHDKGEFNLWKMQLKNFEERKTDKISGGDVSTSPLLVKGKEKFWILAKGNIQKLNADENKMEPINIDFSFSRQMGREFSQVFFETWTTIEENFYDDKFHGVDWGKMLNYYSGFLPHIRNRENLRVLLNDMLGELNASHMGFSGRGKEEETFFKAETAETGIIFSDDNPYRVERVLTGSALDLTQAKVQEGDILVAVNGQRVEPGKNRNSFFYFASRPSELELTFSRGREEFRILTATHTPGQINELFYDEWIRDNRRYVEEKTGNRIAYVYMKNMSEKALEQFLIDMTTYGYQKEALLFDIRFNRGGNVHDDVLQFLSQRPYLSWRYRGGNMSPQPNFAPSANPMVLVANERSLSDAEMTAEGFRRLELGKIVGVETYRWIIFTSGKGFVDGSFCRLPSWGCYTLDGKNLEQTGVSPDVEVRETFHDRLHNRRPQLDKAIEMLLNK